MTITIQFTSAKQSKSGNFIFPVTAKTFKAVKKNIPAGVTTAVEERLKDAKTGECFSFSADNNGALDWYVFVVVETGKALTALKAEEAGGRVYAHLQTRQIKSACLMAAGLCTENDAAHIANGALLRSYEFKKYKTDNGSNTKKATSLHVHVASKAAAEKAFKPLGVVTKAVFAARNWVNEPPNTLYPQSYEKQIKSAFKGTGAKITVLDEKKLDKMGAGAILAVGQGSNRPPRMVIVEYNGLGASSKKSKPVALVGKGVTYDTGGYSLKPRTAQETMKMDMGGSAGVLGAVKALAQNKIKIHVVGVVALAENMISGNAYRVDDVLTSLSGQTIEVINTDAEGRLCLADALTYVQNAYDPKVILDMATLTGACMAALGLETAGVFTTDKKLANLIETMGEETGDPYWRLPLTDTFTKQIESPVADMRNLAMVPYAGASTAAAFLQKFVDDDRTWAHLDIAGPAWRKKDAVLGPQGATGFGVRSLYALAQELAKD